MLEIQELTITRDSNKLSYDITVSCGEHIAIQGPSGVGKTTLLQLLAGYEQQNSGQILWQGKNIEKQQAELRPISMLFQDHNLFEHLTAWQNIQLGFPTPPVDKLQQAAKELKVENLLDKTPPTLSGGQRQRIGLIRTLLRPEPIILLDEPFAELDIENRLRSAQWVKHQATQLNKTLLVVTHHQEDVDIVADRVITLN